MKFKIRTHLIPFTAWLLVAAWVGRAEAQLELGTPQRFNHLQLGIGSAPATPPAQPGNGKPGDFSSVGVTSGSAGSISTSDPKFPQAVTTDDQSTPVNTTQLRLARFGNSFGSGVPRYFLGNEIVPPAFVANGSAPAPPGYWRAKPVRPDELFNNPNGSNLADTAGNDLVSPAGSNGKPLPALGAGEYEKLYYSPHADRVFASQSGAVEILWVTSDPQPDVSGSYKFLKETFNVSGAASGGVRTIYWTEKSFDGPRVNIPAGRIVRANPVYNANFPPEMEEYEPVGGVVNPDPDAQPPEERRTLWFEKIGGNGQLAAYNREGRILVEYLGAEISPGIHEFLGADVVQVEQAARAVEVTVKLGEQVYPEDGDSSLTPAPLLDLGVGQNNFYGTLALPNDQLVYHAERENLSSDRVIFYWLEDNDADIHLLPEPQTPGLNIRWPKYKNRYLFVWPDELSEFAHITTDPGGSSADTGVQFEAGSTPEVIFQDDGAQEESELDIDSQRLIVDLSSGDDWNRTLLKFGDGSEVWYQRLYIQTDDRTGYLEGDELTPVISTATVGSRIERPDEKYSIAGAITNGTGYQPSAYIDPYSVGVEAAEAGAILPVNAVPGNEQLTVRWFEKIEPPSAAFAPFYVPSKIGRYTVSYPDELGSWAAATPMLEERRLFASAMLDDGRVFVVGGYPALSTAEIFNPTTGEWHHIDSVAAGSWGHTATLLADGKVLVVGGSAFGRAEIFDPNTEAWTPVDNSPRTRFYYTVTRLQNGKVLVAGGAGYSGVWNTISQTDLFDPATGTWTTLADMSTPRVNHAASLLPDGRVLVTGGEATVNGGQITNAEIFDPVQETWTSVASMGIGRFRHSSTLLDSGKVLIAGGLINTSGLTSAEVYDPVANSWTATGNEAPSRMPNNRATLMPDGKVLVVPGSATEDGVSLYDPVTDLWTSGGALMQGRNDPITALLQDGQVLVAGGSSGDPFRTVEMLDAVGQIVMASNRGAVSLTTAQAEGSLYVQNDASAIGYQPNEEHALKLDNTFWALRDDLNVTSGAGYTSEPFVLVAYTDPDDGRPAMRPFRVRREDTRYKFDYPWTAGTKIQGPLPLPLLPIPVDEEGVVANTEVPGVPDPAPDGSAPDSYDRFTFEDRQGFKWVYRGPHDGGSPTLGMQWYYPMQPGFSFPDLALDQQPEPGTTLPYLRPFGSVESPVGGTALTVVYRPTWPDSVPSMRLAETLTLPKYGLPDVRNQNSAEVFYQQSVAIDGETKESVTLHDPTRNKSMPLADAGLEEVPDSIRTTDFQGRTYFQGLPPHLQQRFYLDPFASARGSLILAGEFHDEIAGEDYLDLNVLSDDDEAALKALAANEPGDVQSKWESAIDGLNSRLETFIEDPSRAGTYIVDQGRNVDIGGNELAEIPDPDTARDSYALTASGNGAGYVTLLFSNGVVPDLTPQGDPPVVQIVKVTPELYNGDLKVRLSSNPLDEQVTLRHSGDFAARPQDYEFEWRYAQPVNGSAPPTYSYTNVTPLGDPGVIASRQWRYVRNPAAARPSAADYSAALWTLADSKTIADEDYNPVGGLPGVVLKAKDGVDFTAEVPANITFSADLDELDGFAVYVNGAVALVHRNGILALDNLALENAYELLLKRSGSVGDLPVEGERLMVIAEIDDALHFRIFDAGGTMVIDTDESQLASKIAEIAALKGALAGLWSPIVLSSGEKSEVAAAAASILDFDLDSDATSGLSATGLSKQFAISSNFFLQGLNTFEVALYTAADPGSLSTINLRLEGATKTDLVLAGGTPWLTPSGTLQNTVTVGGSPTAPLGSPLLVMQDNFFTMRYRAKPGTDAFTLTGGTYSDWARPALVEGWIKRVLAAINPFNQRISDLFNNAVNTDVSLLTQAGGRWEGDVALTLDAIDDTGLIAIYETVLNRGKEISIDSGYDNGGVNDALLLAAGYLNDLYTILGNEAFADAANPTISIDDQDSATEINTSRYSFEGQVASVLDEELALLRGRDDFLNPQVTQSPFYNRLFWNYTRGIDSGEALYATNYNIKEKVGSSTEDGSIDAADAARMFPQGHGDAYGHYLTALKSYSKLLTNPNFTWVPRSESLNILGNTVSVDYQDERKFAAAAANVARTAEQVVALTHRRQYTDDPADGWEQFRDGETGGEFNTARHFGLDEWASRSAQGAYYHWAVGNAMLPDVDEVNTGIQKIDRTTVPELELLAVSGDSFQTTLDNANAHLNPLGLSPGAIAFDIDPAELRAGNSHYEQIYERSLAAVLNAKGAFDQAARMTRLLRNQENQIDGFNTSIEDEERGFNYKLIDMFGTPYPDDVGPGKTYAQGYAGPDLNNWFVVDRPTTFVDNSEPILFDVRVPVDVPEFRGFEFEQINASANDPSQVEVRSLEISSNQFIVFADQWKPETDIGKRSVTGRLQQALADTQLAYIELQQGVAEVENAYVDFDQTARLVDETLAYHKSLEDELRSSNERRTTLALLEASYRAISAGFKFVKSQVTETSISLTEALPTVVGTSTDPSSAVRGSIRTSGGTIGKIAQGAALLYGKGADLIRAEKEREGRDLVLELRELELGFDEIQLAYEYELQFDKMVDLYLNVAGLAVKLQREAEEVRSLLALGDRIQLEREIFRKRAATVVQGYRTNDLTFRAFRNEALEQYRTLFDLAGRYTYLAAKSYDYETGLLGTDAGQAVINRIVVARALGDLTDGQPQATVSTLGDAGLAGTMAQLQADWSVAEGRLGINNPDQNGTLFSLRSELFRIMDDPLKTEDDTAWRQTLEQHMVSDLMSDADVATHCRNLRKPDGSAVPGIVISFSSTIEHGKNFFGLPGAGGDHAFSASNFATKIYSVGVVLEGYVGMDPYAEFIPGAGEPATNDPNSLMATPYLYLIPTGVDKMLAPPLGDTGVERSWTVHDQALPLPYNLGANAFSTNQFFDANGTLTEQPWILRKHQAFRPVDDPAFFYSGLNNEFDSSRLIGRSVWNTGWKIVIPAYGLLNDEQEGLDRFAKTVSDIKLFLRTYSHSGN